MHGRRPPGGLHQPLGPLVVGARSRAPTRAGRGCGRGRARTARPALAEQVDEQVAVGQDVARSDRVRHWVPASSRLARRTAVVGRGRPPIVGRFSASSRAERQPPRHRVQDVGHLAQPEQPGQRRRRRRRRRRSRPAARSAATAEVRVARRAGRGARDASVRRRGRDRRRRPAAGTRNAQQPPGLQTAEQVAQHEVGQQPTRRRTTRCRRAPAPARCPRRWSTRTSSDRGRDVGGGDDALDPEHRAGALEGVEAAQGQVVDGEEEQADAEQGERRREQRRTRPRRRPSPRSRARGRRRSPAAAARRAARRPARVRSDIPRVRARPAGRCVGGVRAEPGQDRGRQRDRDHRVRDHHDQEASGVDRVAGAVAAGPAVAAVPPEASRTTTV